MLRDQGPGSRHILIQIAVFPRKGHIHSAGQHGNHRSPALQGTLDSMAVYAFSYTGYHQSAARRQLHPEPLGIQRPIGGSLPGAHHTDGRLLIKVEGPPTNVEDHGGSAICRRRPG